MWTNLALLTIALLPVIVLGIALALTLKEVLAARKEHRRMREERAQSIIEIERSKVL